MGVEVDGFEMAPPPAAALVEVNKASLSETVNGQLDQGTKDDGDTKFGSHGDGLAGQEASKISEANYPQDVHDEWPAPNKIHNFFLVRFRAFEDPQMKMKLDRADKEIQQKNQARFQITDKLKAKRSERAGIISQLKALGVENKQFNMAMDEKRKKMEPLQQALGKLRNPNTANRGSGLCSSEEELNDVIMSLQYRIQHESILLAEEKQIIREIKQLEGTRDKVIANAAMRAEIQGLIGPKEDIQDQVKLIGVDLDEVRKEKQAIKAKIKQLRDELDGIDSQIKSLQDELEVVVENRDKAYSNLQDLRKKRDEGNVPFYQNRTLFNSVRELAAKKDVVSLVDLSLSEVEKFFSIWNGSKKFRDDYQKRILTSLDGRQMSMDGRTRLPSEKLLVAVEKLPAASEVEAKPKAEEKKPKEVPRSPAQEDPAPVQKVEKERTNKANEPVKKSKTKELEPKESKDDEDVYEIPKHEPPPVVQIDVGKLKKMKREEQIAKQKQALERKKKLADKNAAKAAIKAQKEAEKRLKDQEKKMKKKGNSAETEESAEGDAPEPEKPEETPEAPPAQIVAREKTVKTIKVRKQSKAPDSVPKAIFKRRKSNNYWVWAAGSAALAVFLCLIFAFYGLR